MRRMMITMIALATVLAPSAAFADDFTFTVPVRIENMPHLTSADVWCGLGGVDARGSPRSIGPSVRTAVVLTAGAFRGNVRVVVNLPAGERRDAVRNWSCHMNFFARASDGRAAPIEGNTDAQVRAEYTRVTGQEVASSRLQVQGTP